MTPSHSRKWLTLLFFLVAAQILYAPAWRAGWVRDVTGWLESIHTQNTTGYLLRQGKRVQSFYPFTQAALLGVYKVLGMSALAWHLLMVSMHAVCSWGWMRLASRLLWPSGRKGAEQVSLFAGAAFLLSPYATEVVVWEAGFHYMLAMLLQLATLWCVLRWMFDRKPYRPFVAVALFLPALASLEVFLLTPVFAAILIAWGIYYKLLTGEQAKQASIRFLLPMLLLCALQYIVYRLFYTRAIPHIGSLNPAWFTDYLRKPGKYLFHLALGGRYWPEGARKAAYCFLNSPAGVVISFGLLAFAGWITIRKKASPQLHTAGIFYGFFLAAGALVTPLHFHESGLVYFDRYAYFMLAPAAVLVGLALQQLPYRKLVAALYLSTCAALLFGTIRLWRDSDRMSRSMLTALPPTPPGTLTVLLNVPNALRGIPMIGATQEGEAALMRRYVYGIQDRGLLLEPTACNLLRITDTVVVRQTRPETLQVSLCNGQGWWSGGVPTENWHNGKFFVEAKPFSDTYSIGFNINEDITILYWQDGAWHRFPLDTATAH